MLRAFYLSFAALVAAAQTAPVAITGARVIPIAGAEIDNGVVVFQNGRIVSVGGANTAIPQGAQRIDARGKVVMPGFVDSHSHIGGVEGGDGSGPIQPEVRVLDAINVRDARIQKAQAGGVTVAALKQLAEAGELGRDERTVVYVTGNGLKNPDAVAGHLNPLLYSGATLQSFESALGRGSYKAA